MTSLPDFRLEAHFSRWEFKAKYHLTASDAQSMTLGELLALDGPQAAESFSQQWLGYTETYGNPSLRAAIAATYSHCEAADVLCFAGAEEGLYLANRVLLEPDDHAIVITPNYQAAETVPLAICAVTGVPLDPAQNWSLDLDQLAAAIRPNSKMVSINFPHNPTGAILPAEQLEVLIALCRRHGLWLFSDEVYRGLGAYPERQIPQVADLYEKGLSLNVMSKAYGLPGLRIGWIACQDRALLQRLERAKHYLSICNAGPSEALAEIALRHRDTLLERNNALLRANLALLDAFFGRYPNLFDWQHPDGGCIAFPRYKGPDGVDAFAEALVDQAGVLVLPAGIYHSDLGPVPNDRFRIGFGRQGMADGLAAFSAFLEERA
jgi:aspartate/methionine/tyrosine aminotransferase